MVVGVSNVIGARTKLPPKKNSAQSHEHICKCRSNGQKSADPSDAIGQSLMVAYVSVSRTKVACQISSSLFSLRPPSWTVAVHSFTAFRTRLLLRRRLLLPPQLLLLLLALPLTHTHTHTVGRAIFSHNELTVRFFLTNGTHLDRIILLFVQRLRS